MKLVITIITLIVCVFCTTAAIGKSVTFPVKVSALTNAQKNLLDAKLDAALKLYGIVGQSIAILKNGQLVYKRSIGLDNIKQGTKVNNDTVYSIYSVTKLFVISLILDLVESNQINLDESIGHYLKNLPVTWKPITVRQLLSHTSGLPEYFSINRPIPKTQELIIKQIAEKPFQFPIGSKSQYNQTGFLLIKMIIEQQTRQDFISAINSRVINKLGLDNTSFGGGDINIKGRTNHYYSSENGQLRDKGIFPFDSYSFASSGLNSNIADLAKWFGALLSGKIVSKETLLKSWQANYHTDGAVSEFTNGWQYNKDEKTTTVGHLGGNSVNFRHIFFNENPNEAITVIHLTNGRKNAAFDNKEFSIALADVVMSGLMSEVVKLKYQMHEFIAKKNINAAISVYQAFKKAPLTKNVDTQAMINSLGYELMLGNKNIRLAINVFKLNISDYPKSANPYDSLAEAYLKLGNSEFAAKYYRKALALNPDLDYIPEILNTLNLSQ